MNESEQLPTIRAPWTDELSRTWDFLGKSKSLAGRLYPRIAVTGEPERIVAAGAVQTRDDSTGRLHLVFRTRFCREAVMKNLLQEMEEIARARGIASLSAVVPEMAPWRPALEQAGFSLSVTDEWWEIPRTEKVRRRLAATERMVPRLRAADGLSAGPLREEDFAEIESIVSDHGLANLGGLGQERMVGRTPGQYSAELSTVVRSPKGIAGVFLVHDLNDKLFVHVRTVLPEFMTKSWAIYALFLARCLEKIFLQNTMRNASRFLFTARSGTDMETIAMAKRFGGTRLNAFCNYTRNLQASSRD